MLLPIMVGLEMFVSLSGLEANNDRILEERFESAKSIRGDEKKFMLDSIAAFDQAVINASTTTSVCPVLAGGFVRDSTGPNCFYWLDPDPVSRRELALKGRGRFVFRLSPSGVVSDKAYCFVDRSSRYQACAEESS